MWARLQAAAQRELITERMAPLTPLQALQILRARELGVGRLRLLPKMTGMRPIINMGRPSRAVFQRLGHLVAGGAGARAEVSAVDLCMGHYASGIAWITVEHSTVLS